VIEPYFDYCDLRKADSDENKNENNKGWKELPDPQLSQLLAIFKNFLGVMDMSLLVHF